MAHTKREQAAIIVRKGNEIADLHAQVARLEGEKAALPNLWKALRVHDEGLEWESQGCHICCSSWKPGKPAWHHEDCLFHPEGQAKVEGCGYPPKQRELLERNATLEGEVAALGAALKHHAAERHRWGGHGETERVNWQQCSNEECRLAQDALSGTGKGWLPPEVREQARDILDDFDRWQDEHINANPGNVPACLGRDCPGCKLAREKLRAALDALGVK